LQHGITRDYVPIYSSKKIKLKLFVTAAVPEHEFILENFNFSNNVVKLLGFARYDNLLNNSINDNQILIMPTWREYLRYVGEEDFVKSEYYISWKGLLESEELNSLLKSYNKKVIFYLHNALQKFRHLFTSTKDIVIANNNVKHIIACSEMLLTSLIAFAIAADIV